MRFGVVVTVSAKADIQEAYLWIADQSRDAAEQWLEGLIQEIDTLKTAPARCPLAPESDVFDKPIRQLLYGKRRGVYRILFLIQADEVLVLHVRHAARDVLQA
jgi:plasmid stabilization system protein ParE